MQACRFVCLMDSKEYGGCRRQGVGGPQSKVTVDY